MIGCIHRVALFVPLCCGLTPGIEFQSIRFRKDHFLLENSGKLPASGHSSDKSMEGKRYGSKLKWNVEACPAQNKAVKATPA